MNFDSFKVYLFEIEGNEGTFYKIGKTFRKCLKRISDIGYDSEKKYHATKIRSFSAPDNSKNSSDMIFDIENYCHRKLREYSYRPKIQFGGYTECFSHIPDDFDFLEIAINLPTELPTLSLN